MDSGPDVRRPPRDRRAGVTLVVSLLVVAGVLWVQRDTTEPLPDRPRMYDDGSYTFLATQSYDDAVPVTYDRCRPLVVTMNPQDAPPEAEEVVRTAMRMVATASSLRLEWGGISRDRPLQSRGYGPIHVAFTDEAEMPNMTEDVAGRGGSSWQDIEGQRAYFQTGQVQLSKEYFARLSRSGSEQEMLHVVLHELGHVVGLGHVDDPDEVMDAGGHPQRQASWGHGDLTGLAILGTQPCA